MSSENEFMMKIVAEILQDNDPMPIALPVKEFYVLATALFAAERNGELDPSVMARITIVVNKFVDAIVKNFPYAADVTDKARRGIVPGNAEIGILTRVLRSERTLTAHTTVADGYMLVSSCQLVALNAGNIPPQTVARIAKLAFQVQLSLVERHSHLDGLLSRGWRNEGIYMQAGFNEPGGFSNDSSN